MLFAIGPWTFVRPSLGGSASVALGNAALRHQLAVLRRPVRPAKPLSTGMVPRYSIAVTCHRGPADRRRARLGHSEEAPNRHRPAEHRGIWLYRAPIDGELRRRGRRRWLRGPRRGVETNDHPSHCDELFSARLPAAGARDVGVVEQRDWSWSA